MFWIGVICQLLPVIKLVANGLGYNFADSAIDSLADMCAAGSAGTGAVMLAKSPKAVAVPALRLELAKKS